jgi:hypothetical protein
MKELEASNAEFVLTLLAAIERRDRELLQKRYHPNIEFHWPPGLPYSGVYKGETVAKMQECFGSIWIPLQPTEEGRRMDFACAGDQSAGAGNHQLYLEGFEPGWCRFRN